MVDRAEWIEELHARGVTDGLPVVPPTPERVWAAAEASGRLAHELVGLVAPQFGRATVEKIAVNAVMAGCRSEYLPVVLAAVEAICDPDFALLGVSGTTDAVAPLLILDGPGSDGRSTSTAASACSDPDGAPMPASAGPSASCGPTSAALGPAASACLPSPSSGATPIASGSEEENPWAALHVEYGFAATDNTVAALAAEAPQIVADTQSRRAEDIAITLARSGEVIASYKLGGLGDTMLVLGPEHVRTIAGDGWSKADVRRFVWERTQASVKGTRVAKFRQPDNVKIIVAGGTAGRFSSMDPRLAIPRRALRRSSSRRSAGSEGRALTTRAARTRRR